MSKHIIDGLRYAYEASCRGDSEGAVDAIAVDPNMLWIEPNEFYAGGTYRGREEVIDCLSLAYAASEQVQHVSEEILVVGDKMAVFFHFQAWPKGGGEPREGHIADVSPLHEGKVVQMQAYADPAQARKAIGSPHHSCQRTHKCFSHYTTHTRGKATSHAGIEQHRAGALYIVQHALQRCAKSLS